MDALNLLTYCKLNTDTSKLKGGMGRNKVSVIICNQRYTANSNVSESLSELPIVRLEILLQYDFRFVTPVGEVRKYLKCTVITDIPISLQSSRGVTEHLKGLIKETRPVCYYLSVIACWIVLVWKEGDRERENKDSGAELGSSHYHFCGQFSMTDGNTIHFNNMKFILIQQVHFL